MKTIKDKEYSFNHFKERLKERHNLDITENHYDDLCSMMELYKTFPPISVEKQKNDTQMVYEIVFKETMIKVVWSETRNLLTTVLPKIKKGE